MDARSVLCHLHVTVLGCCSADKSAPGCLGRPLPLVRTGKYGSESPCQELPQHATNGRQSRVRIYGGPKGEDGLRLV